MQSGSYSMRFTAESEASSRESLFFLKIAHYSPHFGRKLFYSLERQKKSLQSSWGISYSKYDSINRILK